jgi:hypothetical protein
MDAQNGKRINTAQNFGYEKSVTMVVIVCPSLLATTPVAVDEGHFDD